ncbi:hypothetical protein FACS189475_07530 [Betaproteobacteria bacterium]|nr:hypothetical protein FACS189475_07530 [Betaproteobacteria bacterium]
MIFPAPPLSLTPTPTASRRVLAVFSLLVLTFPVFAFTSGFQVRSVVGEVRWTREWDGTEWKFNPQWESLSQSWKNLTGSQSICIYSGTARI